MLWPELVAEAMRPTPAEPACATCRTAWAIVAFGTNSPLLCLSCWFRDRKRVIGRVNQLG